MDASERLCCHFAIGNNFCSQEFASILSEPFPELGLFLKEKLGLLLKEKFPPRGSRFFPLRVALNEKEGNYFYARVISLERCIHPLNKLRPSVTRIIE